MILVVISVVAPVILKQIVPNWKDYCSVVNLSLVPLLFMFVFSVLAILWQIFRLARPDVRQIAAIFGPLPSPQSFSDSKKEDERDCECHSSHHHRPLPMRDPSYSIIGHRGGGGGMKGAPENTLAAIRKCASRGCSMVELDVSLTKDLVPVLFHDDNLLRIMGVNRRIREINWGDLRRIDISQEFPGERVPMLEEAVELCLDLDLRFIIDIKEDTKMVESIVSVFKKHKSQGIYSKGVVSSFYFSVIYKIRKRDARIVGCLAWRPSQFALPLQICGVDTGKPINNAILEAIFGKVCVPLIYLLNDLAMKYGLYSSLLGISALLVHKDALTVKLVDELKKMGVRVYAWTANCPVEKEYLLNKLQVGYLTDTLDAQQQQLQDCAETWLCNNNDLS